MEGQSSLIAGLPVGGHFWGVQSRINIKLGLLSKQCLAKIKETETTNNDQMARNGQKCT